MGKGIGDVPHLAFIWIINKTSYVNCSRPDRTENTLVLITLIQAVEAKYFCLKILFSYLIQDYAKQKEDARYTLRNVETN